MASRTSAKRAGKPPMRSKHTRCLLYALLVPAAVLAAGCFGGSKKKASTPPPAPTQSAVAIGTAAPAPPTATIAAVPTVIRPFTPPAGTPRPTPSPTPAANIRDENGLKIQDVQFVGRVTTPGGLRIRSAPDASASNVVGSVPEGALITVEGKVLNGAEAEQGKGTVWYIVGVKQYVYGAEGYVQPVSGATPVPGG